MKENGRKASNKVKERRFIRVGQFIMAHLKIIIIKERVSYYLQMGLDIKVSFPDTNSTVLVKWNIPIKTYTLESLRII